MIVRNNTETLIHIPLPKNGGEIVLLPGANPDVDPKKWAEAATFVQIKAFLKLRKKGGIEVDEKTSSPVDLKVEDAIDLVDETVDVAILKKWLAAEKRDEVKAAIEAQIEKLDPRADRATGDFESAS